MTIRLLAVAALAAALVSPSVLAGAMDECEGVGDREAVAKCLSDLDLETLAALKRAEIAAGKSARELEVTTKVPGAYTTLAASSRAFTLYQQAQCDYARALQPDANARPISTAPSAADLAKLACRIDLARDRIELLK